MKRWPRFGNAWAVLSRGVSAIRLSTWGPNDTGESPRTGAYLTNTTRFVSCVPERLEEA
jgi:hypothetical protein